MSYIDELRKYHRVTAPNKESLSELVVRAKGARRSMRQFANECNVNPSTLSRIVNQKTQGANSDDLIATIAEHADPDSGVTFEMLMRAHGMALVSDDSSAIVRLQMETIKAIVLKELLRRFYTIRDGQEPWLNSFLGRCLVSTDMRTDALGKEGAVWLMDIWTLRPSEEKDLKRASDRLRQWLLMYVGMLNVDKRQVDRFSIILSNEELYRAVVEEMDSYMVKNDISLILIDIGEEKIIEEYLVQMERRSTNENVFFEIEEDQADDKEDLGEDDLFERPEII